MKTIIRFQTFILAAGSDKRSKRSGSTIQVQRKQSIIVTFFTIAQMFTIQCVNSKLLRQK